MKPLFAKPLFAAGLLVGLFFAFPHSQAATAPAPASPLPGLSLLAQQQAPQSRAQPVQWYCRADCNACRRTCDYRYRSRRTFTLCMRDCWNSVCRWC